MHHCSAWLVMCDCGQSCVRSSQQLKSDQYAKKCSNCRIQVTESRRKSRLLSKVDKSVATKSRKPALIGKVFGELEVLEQLQADQFRAECSCGATVVRTRRSLTAKGKQPSCGCKNGDKISKANRKGSLVASGKKICSACKLELDASHFTRSSKSKDLLQCRCRNCSFLSYIKSKFKISDKQYFSLLERQDSRCASCKEVLDITNNKRAVHIDHDHRSGRVRAILCGKCNAALGFLSEDPDKIRALLTYCTTVCKDRTTEKEAWA